MREQWYQWLETETLCLENKVIEEFGDRRFLSRVTSSTSRVLAFRRTVLQTLDEDHISTSLRSTIFDTTDPGDAAIKTRRNSVWEVVDIMEGEESDDGLDITATVRNEVASGELVPLDISQYIEGNLVLFLIIHDFDTSSQMSSPAQTKARHKDKP